MIRLMIIDDSKMIRDLLTAVLQQDSDIKVIGYAANGYEAVEKVVQLKPDIITMDVKMPLMDGLEATKKIMAWRPTPILIVSSYTRSNDLDIVFEAMKAGAVDVYAKPGKVMEKIDDEWGAQFIRKIKTLSDAQPHPSPD